MHDHLLSFVFLEELEEDFPGARGFAGRAVSGVDLPPPADEGTVGEVEAVDLPAPDLTTMQAFEKAAPAINPWGGAPLPDVAASGQLAGIPGLEAGAVTQPMASVSAQPAQFTNGFADLANAGPFGGDYAAPADRFGPQLSATAPQISQADIARGLFNVTADGQMDPAFTEAMMGPNNPVVPTAVQTTSFSPSVDIASQQPADIASFAGGYETQRGTPTGLTSAESQAMQGHVAYAAQKAREDAQLNSFPSMDVPATATAEAQGYQPPGIVTGIPDIAVPNFNQAMNPTVPSLATTPVGLSDYQITEAAKQMQVPGTIAAQMQQPAAVTAYADEPAVGPAAAAIEAQTTPSMTPAQIAGYQQAADTFAQAGMLNIGQQPPTDLGGDLPTNFDVLGSSVPSLETVTVPDQPTVAGPANPTIADPQQAVQSTTTPTPTTTTQTSTRSQPKGLLSGLLSKETAVGGALGGLALGPLGGLAGALIGQQVARNGGLSSMLGGSSFSAPTTQMSGGINNIASIYGGSQAPGTYAVANNGATIAAQPGGYTTYTSASGVTNAVGPDGKISGYFGSAVPSSTPDTDTESGGFFGGFFGS